MAAEGTVRKTYKPNDTRCRFPFYADNLVAESDVLRAVRRRDDKP